MFEGSQCSEGHFGLVGALQGGVDFPSVGAKCAAKAVRMAEQIAGATTDGGIVDGGRVVVEQRMFGKKGEPQGDEGRADEIRRR